MTPERLAFIDEERIRARDDDPSYTYTDWAAEYGDELLAEVKGHVAEKRSGDDLYTLFSSALFEGT